LEDLDKYESGDGMPLLDIDACDFKKGIFKAQGRPKRAKSEISESEGSDESEDLESDGFASEHSASKDSASEDDSG
jgi:hypothetical protein